MRQGIQTNFPHENLKKYGCYFFALCRWAEIVSGKEFSDKNILDSFEYYKEKGWLEDDCFIINPPAILTNLIDTDIVFIDVEKAVEKPELDIYITYLKKPGHSHFVLSCGGKIWDSLDPGRPGVSDYKIDSFRIIS